MAGTVDLRELAIDRGTSSGSAENVGPPARWGSRIVLPAALLLGFLGLLGWASQDMFLTRTAVTVIPVEVTRSTVRREGAPLFRAAGWIEPRPTAIRVAALEPGVVEQLLVVEDQPVEQGEPIAWLVDEDAEIALATARAELQLKQAEVQRVKARQRAAQTRLEFPVHLEARVAEAETMLAKVEGQLAAHPSLQAAARAQQRYAEQDHRRTEALGSRAASTKNDIDRSLSELETARAEVTRLDRILPQLKAERDALARRVQALRELLRLKSDEIQARDEAVADVAAAEAAVAKAQSVVNEAELRLSRMKIVAPVKGRILDLVTEPGARLMSDKAAGGDGSRDGTTVVTMYEPDRLQVRVDVRFEDLPQVVTGQPVLVESPALPEPLQGHVLFLTSIADIQKNTLEVKVSLDSPPEVLKPEMLVDVTFQAMAQEAPEEPSEELRIFVPGRYVQQGDEGQAFVWVADRTSGVARRQLVEAGRAGPDGMTEILGGLNPSSRLITNDLDELEDGTPIEVTGEGPEV